MFIVLNNGFSNEFWSNMSLRSDLTRQNIKESKITDEKGNSNGHI